MVSSIYITFRDNKWRQIYMTNIIDDIINLPIPNDILALQRYKSDIENEIRLVNSVIDSTSALHEQKKPKEPKGHFILVFIGCWCISWVFLVKINEGIAFVVPFIFLIIYATWFLKFSPFITKYHGRIDEWENDADAKTLKIYEKRKNTLINRLKEVEYKINYN